MPVVEGFEVLTGTYLGQDWEIFGATPDDAIVNFVRYHREDVPVSIERLEALHSSSMSEQQLRDHWALTLYGGYDPGADGYGTFREWIIHAVDLLRGEYAASPPETS